MPTVHYKLVERSDIPAMARIRAAEWETEAYWNTRISRYLDCELHPQHALIPRVSYVASEGGCIVGFIAGHLTRRHACDGELEWINVIPERCIGADSPFGGLVCGAESVTDLRGC
jgi:hypothetical protein